MSSLLDKMCSNIAVSMLALLAGVLPTFAGFPPVRKSTEKNFAVSLFCAVYPDLRCLEKFCHDRKLQLNGGFPMNVANTRSRCKFPENQELLAFLQALI